MSAFDVVEEIAADVHAAWIRAKRQQGITSRLSESGEELMVPYAELSEQAKDLDRASVRAVLGAPAFAARFGPTLSVDGGPWCSCGPDETGEQPDFRPTCDRHGTTPAALAWQQRNAGDGTEEPPF